MLGRKQEFYLKLNEILDCLLLVVSGISAHWLRQAIGPSLGLPSIPNLGEQAGGRGGPAFYWVIALVSVASPLILELLGYYKHPLQKSPLRSVQQLLFAAVWVAFIISGISIFGKIDVHARSFLPFFGIIGAVLLLAKEEAMRRHLRRRARLGEKLERVLLVGPPQDVEKFLQEMPREFPMEAEIVARIDITSQPVEELVIALRDKNIERVFIAASHVEFKLVEEAICACEVQGVEAWLWTGFIQTSIAKPTVDSVGQRPMIVFRSTPDLDWALVVKGVMDKVGASVAIVLMMVPWLIIWLGIKISSPGAPAIFKQKRSGRYGKPFTMYKFRTMVPDAERKRDELLRQNQMSGPVFKVERDPRIFPFGALLRNTSLDETPQFLNVLRGEMSLVGPRPLPYYEAVQVVEPRQRRRFSVKPGLTCLWQISGRNDITDFDQWAHLDLQYIDQWSLWLDLKILIKTIPAVVFSKGAR